MDMENLKKIRQKILDLLPPREVRKLQPKIKKASYTELLVIGMNWLNKFSNKYVKRYFNLAKIILFEIEPSILNPKAYQEYEAEFIKAANHNLDEFNKITIHFWERIKNKFPIDKLINSLLVMMMIIKDSAESPQDINYFEFQKKIMESFLHKVIKKDKERFDIYFFDWSLKFGYLIEGYLKEMLCARLMIKNSLKDLDNTKLFQKTPYIHRILKKLGEDIEQRVVRNSVFHSDFLLEYEDNWDERLITFKNFDEKINFSIRNFLTLFFETIQLILAFGFALDYVHSIKITGDNEKVLEYIKKEGSKSRQYIKSLFKIQKN